MASPLKWWNSILPLYQTAIIQNMTLTQTADKLKDKPTHKCLQKILGHHQPEQLKSSLVLIPQVSLSLSLKYWKPFFQKLFPYLLFWWLWWRALSNMPVENLPYVLNWDEIWWPLKAISSDSFHSHQNIQWALLSCGWWHCHPGRGPSHPDWNVTSQE